MPSRKVPQKDEALLRNLAESLSQRVKMTKSASKRRTRSDFELQFEVESFCFSFVVGLAILLQDRPCTPCVVGSWRRLLICVVDDLAMLEFIEACSHIRSVLTTHGYWDASLFKGKRLRWVRGLVSVIESTVEVSLCTHPSRRFDTLVNFLGWLKRLPICIRDTQLSIDDYYECDRRISSINLDDNVYIRPLQAIWTEWFRSFELQDPFVPHHGPGSTADAGRIKSQKWDSLSIDRQSYVCLRTNLLEPALQMTIATPSRCAKVVFVPKQAGKDRTICMEPAWLQFLQQGVKDQLVAYTHQGKHPLSRLVNIFNQDVNRRLCAFAFERNYATIDLSDASDSVSWDLVKRLTERLPLRRYLFATRSTSALLGGYVSRFAKFAPMGSALCFPIESYVFASVVELAYRMHYGQASSGHLSGCSVYGDDIICPAEIYNLVVDILVSLGFKVNEEKSFSSPPYYESCGVEYLYGARINSIKHPRNHLTSQRKVVSPDRIGLVTDLANTLFSSGYFLARRLFLRSMSEISVRVGSRTVPFMQLMDFSDRNCLSVLESFQSTRWNSLLHCSGTDRLHVEARLSPTRWDYVDFQSTNLPRSRAERIRIKPLYREFNPKWSQKGLIALSRFGFLDLLVDGELKRYGSRHTGRLQYRLRKKFQTL